MGFVAFLLKIPKQVWWLISIVFLSVAIFMLWPRDKNVTIKRKDREREEANVLSSDNISNDSPEESNVSVSEPVVAESVEPSMEDAVVSHKFTLLLKAVENCWVRVKADGQEVCRATLHKGDVESWTAEDDISMWLGNAGGVEIECGDKSYKGFGRRGKVIKDIVFYPDCSYEIRR